MTVLVEDTTIRTQAGANSSQQFVESPDLSDSVTSAVLSSGEAHTKMAEMFFGNDAFKLELVKLLGRLVHSDVNRDAG